MSASIMTPNRFGSSHTGNQQAFVAAAAPSMADTLPSIDFNFHDLRERMAAFTSRFDDFIERGRKRVLEERNAFRMSLADVQDQQSKRKQGIEELESKSSNHSQIVAREEQETEEMHEAIRSLSAQKEEHISRRENLKSEITSVQQSIRQKREAQATYQRALDLQARQNTPELRFWEDCLGMRIEGAGIDDRLRFIFICKGGRDIDKECCFELHVGGQEYEVIGTKPRLERDEIEAAQQRLNENKELGAFLKSMRALFVATMQ